MVYQKKKKNQIKISVDIFILIFLKNQATLNSQYIYIIHIVCKHQSFDALGNTNVVNHQYILSKLK